MAIKLETGQVWSGAEGSAIPEIIIGAVDNLGEVEVVSVMMRDVPVPAEAQPLLSGRATTVFQHAPVHREALEASLGSLLRTGEPAPESFLKEYAIWKEALRNGNGRYYTGVLSEVAGHAFDKLLEENPS